MITHHLSSQVYTILSDTIILNDDEDDFIFSNSGFYGFDVSML